MLVAKTFDTSSYDCCCVLFVWFYFKHCVCGLIQAWKPLQNAALCSVCFQELRSEMDNQVHLSTNDWIETLKTKDVDSQNVTNSPVGEKQTETISDLREALRGQKQSVVSIDQTLKVLRAELKVAQVYTTIEVTQTFGKHMNTRQTIANLFAGIFDSKLKKEGSSVWIS